MSVFALWGINPITLITIINQKLITTSHSFTPERKRLLRLRHPKRISSKFKVLRSKFTMRTILISSLLGFDFSVPFPWGFNFKPGTVNCNKPARIMGNYVGAPERTSLDLARGMVSHPLIDGYKKIVRQSPSASANV
jgi:hypothetical protein